VLPVWRERFALAARILMPAGDDGKSAHGERLRPGVLSPFFFLKLKSGYSLLQPAINWNNVFTFVTLILKRYKWRAKLFFI